MADMTLEDLRRILVDSAGVAELPEDGQQAADVPFVDLGYDSLALIEASARIKREFGVEIPSDQIAELETPRDLVEFVNNAATVH